MKTVGTLAQQQLELINLGFKAAGEVIEPLVKTSSDLVGNVLNSVGQIVQNITSALAPKK
ncbi:MAG: chlorosome envelope protein B [Pelodictyon phaeoclathratiforme]